jgi:hypothetical protein
MDNQEGQSPPALGLESVLLEARGALERGDYGLVRRLLEPLALAHPPRSAQAAELRLLLATALMGQGDSQAAASWCRSLRGCQDPQLRAMAKDLELVLEAPALQRPRNWSLTLPDFTDAGSLESLAASASRRRRNRRIEPPPPPPVGPTRAPVGFAALAGVLLALVLLASLLGGCMEVRTDLRFAGPGRVQISHHLSSASASGLPWQRAFGQALNQQGFRSRHQGAQTILQTGVLPIEQARSALVASLEAAAKAAGQSLPEPRLAWQERNWLVGVQQHLLLELDLQGLPSLPGLDLSLSLEPLQPRAVRLADPGPVQAEAGGRLRWPLRIGGLNRLEIRCWRWSPLGLGGVAVALLLPLVLGLQRLRRQLGFGLPELPA